MDESCIKEHYYLRCDGCHTLITKPGDNDFKSTLTEDDIRKLNWSPHIGCSCGGKLKFIGNIKLVNAAYHIIDEKFALLSRWTNKNGKEIYDSLISMRYSDEVSIEAIKMYRIKLSKDKDKSKGIDTESEIKILLKLRYKETKDLMMSMDKNLSYLVGNEQVKNNLNRKLMMFVNDRADLIKVHKYPDCGCIVCGIPGTAKTELCLYSVNDLILKDNRYRNKYKFIMLSVSDFVGKNNALGQSEFRSNMLFKILREYNLKHNCYTIIFSDECQLLLKDRNTSTSVNTIERTNVLFMNLGGVYDRDHTILFIGTTNIPDDMDIDLFSNGRFGFPEIMMIPTDEERLEILTNFMSDMHLNDGVKLDDINNLISFYTGRDLMALSRDLQVIYNKRVKSGKYNPHPRITERDIMDILTNLSFRNTKSFNIERLGRLSGALIKFGINFNSDKSEPSEIIEARKLYNK